VTVVPIVTLSGFGAKAVVVRVDAPLTMDTGVPDVPEDDPDPVEGADGESDPHADRRPMSTTAQPIRERKLMLTSSKTSLLSANVVPWAESSVRRQS
jgi:hypothetical protein